MLLIRTYIIIVITIIIITIIIIIIIIIKHYLGLLNIKSQCIVSIQVWKRYVKNLVIGNSIMNGNRICLLDLVKEWKGLFTYVGDLVVATSKSSCRCWGSKVKQRAPP